MKFNKKKKNKTERKGCHMSDVISNLTNIIPINVSRVLAAQLTTSAYSLLPLHGVRSGLVANRQKFD